MCGRFLDQSNTCPGSCSAFASRRAVLRRLLPASCALSQAPPCAGLLPARSDARHLLHLFTSNLLNVLLLAIPFGWAAHFAHWPAAAVFVLVSQHVQARSLISHA